MKVEAAAAAGHLPPLGMGRIIRSVRTPHGVQHAWVYDKDPGADPVAWITYGKDRVRAWGVVELIHAIIEDEARAHGAPSTIGWEVVDV